MDRRLTAHLSLLAANLIYGANYTIAKEVMPAYIAPYGFVLLRCAGAVMLFWLTALAVPEKVSSTHMPRLVLCAVFGIAINQLLFLKGLSLTHPINASILMTATPILVLIMAAVILREPITWQRGIGVATGLSGAMLLLLWDREVTFMSATFMGDVLIFLNAASYGVFLVLVAPLMSLYHPITVMRWVFTFGAFMVIPFGFGELSAVLWHTFTPQIWAGTAFVVVGLSYFAYLFNSIGLRHLSPSVVSIYIYLQPLLATLIAVFMGKDALSMVDLVSALLVFGGVYLVSVRPGQQAKA
jgi:drug/metabolite transporter (DMT)-like permease